MRDSHDSRRRGLPTVALLLIAMASVSPGCDRQAFVDRSPPEEEPQGEVEFAGSTPKNAFHFEEGNVLARTAFSTPGPANSQIEIRDFQFPPHARTRLGSLPGPGVIEVYSGHGALALSGTTQQLAGGVIKGVPARQALEFDNNGDYSLVVRIYVVEGK